MKIDLNRNLKVGLTLLSTFLISCMALLPRVASHITAGDSGELALAGSTLGVAHSPGYPAFVLVNKILGDLFYFGNEAFRQNMASALISALVIVTLGWLLIHISGKIVLGFFPLILLYFPRFTHQAAVTEVFPLTILWASLLFLGLFGFYRRRQGFFLVAFLFGLGVAVHQTLILLIPGFLAFYYKNKKQPFANLIRDIGPIALFFLLGLSVHLYILVRSNFDPILDWEDAETFSRFWGVVTRERYGFFQLAQGDVTHRIDWVSIVNAFGHMKNVLVDNFGYIGILLLGISSLVSLARRFHRRLIVVCWSSIFFVGPLFFWLTKIPVDTPSDILARFGLLPLIPGIIIIGIGITLIWNSEIRLYRFFVLLSLSLLFIERGIRYPHIAHASIPNFTEGSISESSNSVKWDLSIRESALNVLRMIPDKARLFSDRADETEFSLGFLLNAESRRPGLTFVDCNAGITKSIYGDDYYQIWGKPRLKIRTEVESKIINTSEDPVFYATVDPNMIDIYRSPHGFIYEAKPLKKLSRQKDKKPFPWHEIQVWNAQPYELRARIIKQINLQRQAESLFDSKQTKDAENIFGLVQRLSGSHRYEQMGYWHQTRRHLRKAREYYQKAIDHGIRTRAVLGNMGGLEERRYRFGDAAKLYQMGLEVEPDALYYLGRLGIALYRDEQYGKAIPVFKKILVIDPEYPKIARLLKTSQSRLKYTGDDSE